MSQHYLLHDMFFLSKIQGDIIVKKTLYKVMELLKFFILVQYFDLTYQSIHTLKYNRIFINEGGLVAPVSLACKSLSSCVFHCQVDPECSMAHFSVETEVCSKSSWDLANPPSPVNTGGIRVFLGKIRRQHKIVLLVR